jgi:RNA polymerase sigma-70 factor (ECF subfamily)
MVVPRSKGPSLSVVPGTAAPGTDRRSSRTDEAILAAVRRGDAAVAADFYWRIKPVVERTVRRLFGRSECDGEDLVQIALVQIIESLPSYRGECPLDAWLSAVSANVVYKHIRRRRLERRIFENAFDGPDPPAAASTAGPQRMVVRDTARRVAELLSAMRPDRAWAFVLHDVCGYSLDEVAHICSISVAAAQSRLVRGRRDLHDRIGADKALADALDRDDGRERGNR